MKTPPISWNELKQRVRKNKLYVPVLPFLERLGDSWPTIETYNRVAAEVVADLDITFVLQEVGPKQKVGGSLRSYIEGIAARGEVPTREQSIHDLFNFLTYLMFPKTKHTIMQHHALESAGLPPTGSGRGRTRKQDLLTLFDEGGALKLLPLNETDEASFILFGHGVYEQFVLQPRPITTWAWHVPQCFRDAFSSQSFRELDLYLAKTLEHADVLNDRAIMKGHLIDPHYGAL